MRSTRLAVLLSGSGTTLQNFFDVIKAGGMPAEVAAVLSSAPKAYGLERARAEGVPALVVDRRLFSDSASFSEEIDKALSPFAPELLLLAGFIHLFRIPPKWKNRVMNVHPALIPAFCGKGYYYDYVHEQVLARGVKFTGCTVHFVDNEYDSGPIIVQKITPVLDGDTVDSLKARVQALEREAYPEAVRLFCEGRLEVEGRRVRVLPPRPPAD